MIEYIYGRNNKNAVDKYCCMAVLAYKGIFMEKRMDYVIQMIREQICGAAEYIPQGCIWAVLTTAVILLPAAIWKIGFHKKIGRKFWWKLPPFFLFCVYSYCILQLTVFSRTPGEYGGIDMRFMAKWDEWYGEKAFFIENIIMFIPMGILLPMLVRWMKHIMIAFPAAMVASICIEGIQLHYQLGFCQLDDVVANSIGFLIGFLLYLALYDLYLFGRKIIHYE